MKKGWHQNFRRAPKVNRTSRDGDVFDSKTELMRWEALRTMQRAGMIRALQRQVKYSLDINGVIVGEYTADFVYEVRGAKKGNDFIWAEVVEDVKGFFDKASKFRIAVFQAVHGKTVKLVSLKSNRWVTA